HHLQKTGEDTYAYGVEVSKKAKGSLGFIPLGKPYQDSSQTEHGFVSFFSLPKGETALVWLDGRKYASGQKEMSLRSAKISQEGTFYEEEELDGRTCDCCQTDAASTDDGVVVVYRDRSETEIRDIYALRYEGEKWQEAVRVAKDDWEINGCPVNGPAISTQGKSLAVAWYTAAQNVPQVKLAFSEDGGKSFSKAIKVDLGNPMGRVDVLMTQSNYAYVSWMEKDQEQEAKVMIRAIAKGGALSPAREVGEISSARASGFPILSELENQLILAWTEEGDTPRLSLWRSN
ncbi:MAG: exo-alpha-sialidase, partial [Bacteroidota bacterium]